MIPGQVFVADGDIELNVGRKTLRLAVDNTGDRPVQVGSHYHFYETNPALAFDRPAAYGYRLDIAAGTAVRFEPGQRRTVDLVALDGRRTVFGLRAAVSGKLKAIAPATMPPGPGEAGAGAGSPIKAAKASKVGKPARPSKAVKPAQVVKPGKASKPAQAVRASTASASTTRAVKPAPSIPVAPRSNAARTAKGR